MKPKNIALLAILAFCTLITGIVQAAASIDLSPSVTTVNVGDTFLINFSGNGFTSAVDGGGLNLSFNPVVLQLDSVTLDTVKWEFVPSTGLTNNITGNVTDISFNTFINTNIGSFPIGTFSFTALTAGFSALTLTDSIDFPFGSGGNQLLVTFNNGNVTVVPLPAATWFLLSGVLGLFGLQRRGCQHG